MTADSLLPKDSFHPRSGQTPVAKRAAVHLSRRDGGFIVDPTRGWDISHEGVYHSAS